MLALAFAVLLETRWALPAALLSTAAEASPLPRECRGGDGGVWSRLRAADTRGYCDLLGRGYARLAKTPLAALRAAETAEAMVGPLPAVRVLKGRAQVRLGQSLLAHEQFALAEASDPRALADPKALHDAARAASLAQKYVEAVRFYRLLVSRAALLDDPREQAFCQIEAAALVLAYTPSGVDEALGYLNQARPQLLGLSAWVTALRWLALERAGRTPEPQTSSAVSASADSLGLPSASHFSEDFPVLPAREFEALRAVLREHEGAMNGSRTRKGRAR